MIDPKCDACNQVENLKPCGFCGQPVVIRYNSMTGEHYISHEDWNSKCPQRSFYGSAEQWNTRPGESALRAEIIQWIEAGNAGTKLINEQRAIIAAQGERIEQLLDVIRLRAALSDALHELASQRIGAAMTLIEGALDKDGDA